MDSIAPDIPDILSVRIDCSPEACCSRFQGLSVILHCLFYCLAFLREHLPEAADYYDLLTDFRHGGFRLLGDLVCDMDDLATARERKQLRRPADSPAFQKMMEAYLSAPFSGNERAVVSKVCRKLLNKIVRPSLAVPYVVALGKRNLLWDLLPDHIEEHVLEVNHAE